MRDSSRGFIFPLFVEDQKAIFVSSDGGSYVFSIVHHEIAISLQVFLAGRVHVSSQFQIIVYKCEIKFI